MSRTAVAGVPRPPATSASPTSLPTPTPPLPTRARSGADRTELAVGRIVGLLAMATGVGLLAPLLLVVQQDEAESVGTIVVAVLSAITILTGLVLLLSGSDGGSRSG